MKKEQIPAGFTRVTEPLGRYSGLENVDAQTLKNAQDRGNLVHYFCDLYVSHMLIEEIPSHVKLYVESFIQWFDTYIDKVLLSEYRVSHEGLRLSGQFDLLCKYKYSNDIVLVDFKTPLAKSKTWQLQTAAYRFLLRENQIEYVDRRIALKLSAQGKPPMVYEYKDHNNDEKLYLKLLEIYRFFS